jgi:hypothetical protein
MAKKGDRDPKRERFWRAALQRHGRSGLTAKAFCQQEQLSEAAYYFWRRELARRDRESPPLRRRPCKRVAQMALSTAAKRRTAMATPLFREFSILGGGGSPPATDRCLEIILPDGCRLRLPAEVDRKLLADVLWALETRRC